MKVAVAAGRGLAVLSATVLLALLGLAAVRTMAARAAVNAVEARPEAPAAWARARLERACRLRPDLSGPWRELAARTAQQDPALAAKLQLRALRLDPDNWRNWQQLGLLQYQLGRTAAAERDVERAAQYSTGPSAHFVVANLAFLLGHRDVFWRQMKATLRMAPAQEIQPTLADITRLEGDHPERILSILPPRRVRVGEAAAGFLAAGGHLDAADKIWAAMACPIARRADCRQAADYVVEGWLGLAKNAEGAGQRAVPGPGRVGAVQPEPAVAAARRARAAWNLVIRRGLLDRSAVSWGAVADPDFRHGWQTWGFGWRAAGAQVELAQIRGGRPGNAVVADFTGFEASRVPLLWQWVLVQPGTSYRVGALCRGEVARGGGGIAAEVSFPAGRLVKSVAVGLGEKWAAAQGVFRAPPGAPLLELSLMYRRPLGEPLLRGQVSCRRLTLTRVAN